MRRVTDKDIPKLKPHVGSWVIIRTETNEVVGEVTKFNKPVLKSFNADKVTILPIDVHLASL